MPIKMTYQDLKMRHDLGRSVGKSVTDGNRCALALGVALKLQPGVNDHSFAGQKGVHDGLQNQPFLDKFFLKATDLAIAILKRHGSPDFNISGRDALSTIAGKRGVIYLEDCWQSPGEKLHAALGITNLMSGDHIDIWDGNCLGIYRHEANGNVLVKRARKVWLWAVDG